eukprot:6233452-Alexandrium_andersonii.AAC.1
MLRQHWCQNYSGNGHADVSSFQPWQTYVIAGTGPRGLAREQALVQQPRNDNTTPVVRMSCVDCSWKQREALTCLLYTSPSPRD